MGGRYGKGIAGTHEPPAIADRDGQQERAGRPPTRKKNGRKTEVRLIIPEKYFCRKSKRVGI